MPGDDGVGRDPKVRQDIDAARDAYTAGQQAYNGVTSGSGGSLSGSHESELRDEISFT